MFILNGKDNEKILVDKGIRIVLAGLEKRAYSSYELLPEGVTVKSIRYVKEETGTFPTHPFAE